MKNSDSVADLSALLDMGQEVSPGQESRLDARYVWNLLLRFRWVLIAPFCLAMAVGIYLAATLPRIYRSEATILVEPQSVPDKYVHATVPEAIEARISSLAQQILSSSNLMELIERFKLFSESASKDLVLEEKVEKMRTRLRVQDGRQRGRQKPAFRRPGERLHDLLRGLRTAQGLPGGQRDGDLRDRPEPQDAGAERLRHERLPAGRARQDAQAARGGRKRARGIPACRTWGSCPSSCRAT